ncbi:MAG: hypothetical protein JXN63_06905 [Candidatus Delongbacteria bacterium]|nr:hypothetical protein [Candidatus Delongbacteria bacterium]
MYRMLIMIILSLTSLYAVNNDPISIGSVSFTAAEWDDFYNIDYSSHRINDYTANDRAVILYLFEACFS